jgi:hypothetical protein
MEKCTEIAAGAQEQPRTDGEEREAAISSLKKGSNIATERFIKS